MQKFQKSDFFKLPFQINLLTHRVKYLSIYYLFIIYLFIYLSSIYYLSIFYLFIIYLFNNYLQYLIIIYLFTFHSAQKIKFFIKDFCRKCDQIRSFLQIWSLLLKKSFMENFIFFCGMSFYCWIYVIKRWKQNNLHLSSARMYYDPTKHS